MIVKAMIWNIKNIATSSKKRKMIQKLQEFGFEITFEEIVKTTSHSFGRPHVAKALMKKYPKKFPSVQSVFDQYLGNGKPAYFERKNYPKIKEAIELIKSAGGLAILAHPGVYDQKEVPRLLDYFRACGGQGLETHYSYHLINGLTPEESARRNKFFQEYAQKHSLVQSGGSDFHGEIRKTVKLGEGNLPYSIVVELKKNLKRNNAFYVVGHASAIMDFPGCVFCQSSSVVKGMKGWRSLREVSKTYSLRDFDFSI